MNFPSRTSCDSFSVNNWIENERLKNNLRGDLNNLEMKINLSENFLIWKHAYLSKVRAKQSIFRTSSSRKDKKHH